jgi:1-deoxy-D-xylulose-5-phosphate reductoisomerase
VQSFLDEEIGFTEIPQIISQTMAALETQPASSLEVVLAADQAAREVAKSLVAGKAQKHKQKNLQGAVK